MPAEIPRQQNMFTGGWEDARSTKQRQLDYERDLAPGKQLSLFSQPSEAEIELADEPQAAGLPQQAVSELDATDLLFDVSALLDEPYTEQEPDQGGRERSTPQPSAYDLYMELVVLCEEQAETIWIDPLYADEYLFEIVGLMVVARNAGLTAPELQAAIQIGTWRGTQRKREYERDENSGGVVKRNGSA